MYPVQMDLFPTIHKLHIHYEYSPMICYSIRAMPRAQSATVHCVQLNQGLLDCDFQFQPKIVNSQILLSDSSKMPANNVQVFACKWVNSSN